LACQLVAQPDGPDILARIDAGLVYAHENLLYPEQSRLSGYGPALRIVVTPPKIVFRTGGSAMAEQVLMVPLFD